MRSILLVVLTLLQLQAIGEDGLRGKVMCGYQGWFRTPDDGTRSGWRHYSNGRSFEPGACGIDLWPDVRELDPSDRASTPFRHADGGVAEVYSSHNTAAIRLHFKWMRTYGIDGVFLQRFATETRSERQRASMDAILENVSASSEATGRSWALMYDLTGLKPGQIQTVIDDWKHLRGKLDLKGTTSNPSYLRHRGKPLVALWGLGFSDRDPMLDEWEKLISFLKEDPSFGGCTVMAGVPTYWRTLRRDAVADPRLHEILAEVDVISPWTVGRYNSPNDVAKFARETLRDDVEWCRSHQIDYLPVAFPGFSWHNLEARRGRAAPLNAIPRLGGRFLWSQFAEFHGGGAPMLYVAMFDELDEGTAIFKVRQDPPSTPETPFVAEPGVPEDQYLWLTGQAGRLLRGELRATSNELPSRSE